MFDLLKIIPEYQTWISSHLHLRIKVWEQLDPPFFQVIVVFSDAVSIHESLSRFHF